MTESSEVELAEVLEEVRRIEVMTRRLLTERLAGAYSSVFRGAGVEFDSVREYVPGDDPRSVDWNVTARVGRPFVKKYVDERELSVVFVFDVSASMDTGFGRWSLRQAGARVLGCLALAAVRHDDKVGLITVSDDVDEFVPPLKGAGHALRIIRDCLVRRQGGRATRLGPALEFAGRALRKRSVLFLVSDFATDGWEQPLALCARRHDVIAVRLSPVELLSPPRGFFRFRDPETGRVATVDVTRRVGHAWRRDARAFSDRIHDSLARAGVDCMDVEVPLDPTLETIARPILAFFSMREARGAKR